MSFFCRHDWKKIKETYAPPASGVRAKRVSIFLMERLAFGVTTILWECQKCHEIRKEEMLGKEAH